MLVLGLVLESAEGVAVDTEDVVSVDCGAVA